MMPRLDEWKAVRDRWDPDAPLPLRAVRPAPRGPPREGRRCVGATRGMGRALARAARRARRRALPPGPRRSAIWRSAPRPRGARARGRRSGRRALDLGAARGLRRRARRRRRGARRLRHARGDRRRSSAARRTWPADPARLERLLHVNFTGTVRALPAWSPSGSPRGAAGPSARSARVAGDRARRSNYLYGAVQGRALRVPRRARPRLSPTAASASSASSPASSRPG